MTIDKITHYIGKNLVKFYGNLTAEQLKTCKNKLIQEFNSEIKLPNEIMFKYTIELEYINILLR
jgi:L-arabinose isomerase